MQIEEIIRSCANEKVAFAAVSSIGRGFAREVHDAAELCGMSVGGFTVFSVERFARLGDEAEMRSVRTAMVHAQEPILSGLQQILCIMLAAGTLRGDKRQSDKPKRAAPRFLAIDAEARRDWIV